MRRRQPLLVFGVALSLALLSLLACSPAREPSPPVVLIGVDGLEWSVILPLVRQGRMPVLEGLMQRGRFGRLATQAPAKSPVIWTTVATGKAPVKHGILDFTRPDADGGLALYSSADRTTKALWNILSDAGQRSLVVGWWATFPVEKIEGVMVSPANTLERTVRQGLLKPGGMEDGVADQVHPIELRDEIFEIVEQVDEDLPELMKGVYPEAPNAGSRWDSKSWQTSRASVRADEAVRRIVLHLTRSETFPDVLLTYFSTADVVGHRFWRYHQPKAFRHPPNAFQLEKLSGVVKRTYEHIDTMLGELLAAVPEDATVLVVSDHGMQAKRVHERFHYPQEKESGGHGDGPPGILIAAGPRVRKSAIERPIHQLRRKDLPRLGDIADLAPTILALRGLPVGRDMDGSVLKNLLTPEALEELDLRFVATHDTPEWLAARAGHQDIERPGSQERLEQLRSLGYLDP